MLLQPRPSQVTRGALPAVPLPAAIVLASLVLGGLSLLLPSSPTYDPMAWIIWGREITELDLLTTDGPSWKPLPVLLTTLRSEEHTSELQSRQYLVCRLLLEKKHTYPNSTITLCRHYT